MSPKVKKVSILWEQHSVTAKMLVRFTNTVLVTNPKHGTKWAAVKVYNHPSQTK